MNDSVAITPRKIVASSISYKIDFLKTIVSLFLSLLKVSVNKENPLAEGLKRPGVCKHINELHPEFRKTD